MGDKLMNIHEDCDLFEKLETKVINWHEDRCLIHGSSDLAQFRKLEEEVAELKQSLENGTSPVDDIGDIMVVLINIAERNNLSLFDCLTYAYLDIKDRKGKMNNGVFVKEQE